MSGYLLLIVVVLVPSLIVSQTFKRKIKKYSKMLLNSRLSGHEVAEKMLYDHNIYDVKIAVSTGMLSDHYNPQSKTVSLSKDVYYGNSVASASIAAHECGHAVQHAKAYSFLQLRSALVPVVSASSRFIPWIILAGILMLNVFPGLMLTGIILFALTTLFSFITLPVEFDASRRATQWLETAAITTTQEHVAVKDGLRWAAMTYVVSALASLATLLYYVMIFLGRRN